MAGNLSDTLTALRAREKVPLNHGDDSARPRLDQQEHVGQALDRVRQPDARSIPAPSPPPGRTGRRGNRNRSVDQRPAGHPRSSEGGQPDRAVESITAAVEAAAVEAVRVELEETWSGIMPPPGILAQYEDILPGAADRILSIAETTATGQHQTSRRLAEAEIEFAKNGQSFALLLALITLTASIVFFSLGNWQGGACMVSIPVLMFIKSFLDGHRKP